MRTKRSLLLLSILWCMLVSLSATAQNKSLSANEQLAYYDTLCNRIVKEKSDTSLNYIEQYMKLAVSAKHPRHIASAHFYLGKYHMISGRKTNVAENFFESLRIYEDIRDTLGIARLHLALARLNQQEQNYIEAINYYKKSLAYYEKIKNGHWIHHTLNELGTLYYQLNEFQQAQYYFMLALRSNLHYRQADKAASSINNIALAYAHMGNTAMAMQSFLLSLHVSRLSNNREMLANVLGNIGRLYKKSEDNDSALYYIRSSLGHEIRLKNIENSIICYIDLGEILMRKHSFDSAKYELDTALLLLENHPYQYLQLKALRLMSDYFRQKNDYAQAYSYLNRFQSINDSIAAAEKQQLAQATRLRLALQKKDKEIQELTANFNAQEEQIIADKFKITFLSAISAVLFLLAGMAINNAVKKNKINQQLEELNRERNTLMTMVSHDLKSPLASLQGMLNLLESESDNLTTDQKKYMQYMADIIQNSNDMIKNVIDLGRVYEHNLRMNQTEFALHHTIERIMTQFLAAGAKKNICIEFSNQAQHDQVKADESMLRRILENLLSNAVKFSPLNSAVKIILSNPSSNSICVAVYDQGPGIREDEQDKLFQKFQRLSATPTGNETSSGLGLFIVKELVSKNGGEIMYRNNPGGGSIFSVTLPLA